MPTNHLTVEAPAEGRTNRSVRHRWLAVAAASVALPAIGGAVSLANGTIDMGETIVDALPLAERRAGRPCTLRLRRGALRGPRGHRVARIPRTPQATVAAGLLLVAWIVLQVLVIRTLSLFHPTYLAIGLCLRLGGTAHGAPRD